MAAAAKDKGGGAGLLVPLIVVMVLFFIMTTSGSRKEKKKREAMLSTLKKGDNVLAGAVFAFISSWDELVVTMFITSRRVYTLPRKIWDGIQDNISPSVAAMATVLIVVTLIGIVAHLLTSRRRQDAT